MSQYQIIDPKLIDGFYSYILAAEADFNASADVLSQMAVAIALERRASEIRMSCADLARAEQESASGDN